MRALICLPTYDERENLESMVRALGLLELEGLEVLVIDVSSPDGTLLGFVGCLERRHSDDTTCDLYVVRPDGSGQKRLTRTPGGEGALDWWAPAGSG